jgi:hypothetical protein
MARSDIHFGDGGVKGAFVVGVLASFLALVGCDKTPVWEDTRYLERPPAKPPNCPDLPELKNVTLRDGTISDVRIVQFRETKLYFPADLIESAFIDKNRNEAGFIDSNIIGPNHQGIQNGRYDLRRFDPDIYSLECPGVVHKLVEDEDVEALWPKIVIRLSKTDSADRLIKNLQPTDSVSSVYFTAHIDPAPPRQRAMNGSWNDMFVWRSELQVMIAGRAEGVELWQHSKSLNEFITWLNTPPAARDNDAVFTLKVDDK